MSARRSADLASTFSLSRTGTGARARRGRRKLLTLLGHKRGLGSCGEPLAWRGLKDKRREDGVEADRALYYLNELVWSALIIGAPIMATTLIVGLVISIVQVATQIQPCPTRNRSHGGRTPAGFWINRRGSAGSLVSERFFRR